MDKLSFITQIYVIEAIAILSISILLEIILLIRNRKKGKSNNYLRFLENKKRFFLSPIIVLIVGIVVIGLEFIFEVPQIKTSLDVNISSKLDETSLPIYYHNANIFSKASIKSEADFNKIGDYNIEVSIPYLWTSINKSIHVRVIDMESPTITLEHADGSDVSYTCDLNTTGFSASDNYDGDLTSKVHVEVVDNGDGTKTIGYVVSDSSNNVTKQKITLKIIDDVKPTIALNGSNNITIHVGDAYSDAGATASDEKDGDLTDRIKIDSNVDTNHVGKYVVKYSVTDNSSNAEEATRVVNVSDPNATNGVIYLTFDDGPSSTSTPKILDILNSKGVKATFFIINYSDSNEHLVQREVNEGHTVAVHGYSHEYSQIYSSVDAFMNNITTLRTKIRNSTGVDTKYIRFPGGSSNTVSKSYCPGIMTLLTRKVVAEGYSYFDWNVGSGDAGDANNSSEVYHNVVKDLSKNHANVVLMHDFSNNNKTINALASIIDYGLNNGYRFSRITDDTPMVTHNVNN